MCNNECEGVPISTKCVLWQGKKYDFEDFESLLEFAVDTSQTYLAKPVVDLKTLSTTELNRDQILQLLVDRILQLQTTNSTSSTVTCNVDVSTITNCGTCAQSFCEKLQLLVNVVATQQAEINQLKLTVYN